MERFYNWSIASETKEERCKEWKIQTGSYDVNGFLNLFYNFMQEEKLFINLAKRRFLKSLNDSLRNNGGVVIVKDEISK